MKQDRLPPALFSPDEFRVRPSAHARGRGIGTKLRSAIFGTGRRVEESDETMQRLRAVGTALAARFSLRFASLEAEREGVNAHYGICHQNGVIRIRLRHATTGRLLKESSLVDTLCHELAHLRHFDHSPRFKAFYLRILEEARSSGYYRPGPKSRPSARSLFDGAGCGIASPPRAETACDRFLGDSPGRMR